MLCPLSAGVWGGQSGGRCLGDRGHSAALGVLVGRWWGLAVVLWAGAEECSSYGAGQVILCLLPAACCLPACLMASADPNDFVPAQDKLEWVTPKISLLEAGDADGSGKPHYKTEKWLWWCCGGVKLGPS